MRRVVVESPWAGEIDKNREYLRRALQDCINRGESPIASHGLLACLGILDDSRPLERSRGIDAGHAWIPVAEAVVFYIDRGMSKGMLVARDVAFDHGVPIEDRRIGRV